MKHHSPFKRLGFALALVLCPALTAGSLSPAFAATLEINSTVDHSVYGNSDDGSGTNTNGDPTGNTVHLTGNADADGYWVVGSYSETQDVSGNRVILEGNAKGGNSFGGEATGDNAVTDNHVIINGYNAEAGDVIGGGNWDEEGAGEVSGNTVTITDGAAGLVLGGYGQALVSGNTVTLNGNAWVNGNVYGGESAAGEANGNTVILNNGGEYGGVEGSVGGAYSDVSATGNQVEWTGGYVVGTVYGADSLGSSIKNSVLVNGADSMYTTVIGGRGSYTEALENDVTMQDGVVDIIIGGLSGLLAQGNKVIMTGGEVIGDILGAQTDSDDSVTRTIGNIVEISDGKVGNSVYGGYFTTLEEGSGEVTGNQVIMSGGEVGNLVHGGFSFNGAVTGNIVEISNGEVGNAVYGGFTYNGAANGNQVLISGHEEDVNQVRIGYGPNDDPATPKGVYGGYSAAGEANGNQVVLDGYYIEIKGSVYGGYSEDGETTGNSVTITDSYVDASVFGGRGVTQVSDNHVTLNGEDAYVWGNVYGARGYADDALASDNTVIISGGTVNGNVYGASSPTGSVTGNRVEWTGGTINGAIRGGNGLISTGNSVLVNGADINHSTAVIGGWGADEASGNSVTIQAGTVATVLGGMSNGAVTGNHVTITGGTVTEDILGGQGDSEASGNIVEISGGVFEAVTGGFSSDGKATDNHIIISGGTVDGGILPDAFAITGGNGSTGATGNSITLMEGGSTLDLTKVTLIGGTSKTGDHFSGNTLNVKTSGLSINGLNNFEFLNFYLPTDFEAGDTMLTINDGGVVWLADADTNKSSVINVGIDGNSSALKAGDSMILIDASDATLHSNEDLNDTATGYGKQGSTLDYIFGLTVADKQLVATVEDVSASEDSKVLSEGVVSGLALATQGSDLTAGEGLGQAVSAAALTGFGTFSAMGAGSLKYDTGSSVDVNGFSLMAGLSFGNDLDAGRLTMGAFFEYGNGSYDTHNSFSGVNVDGGGDTDYVGGGLLGRMDFAESDSGHFYTEFSARMGRLSNDFKGSDTIRASYESSASYHGLHAGLGYVWNVGEKTFLDLYGKYLWTHQGGDSVKLSTGDPLEFEAADSHRVRVGGRLSYQANENIAPYVGAAYEHEFDGKAMATTYGRAIDAPDMKGGTGIGELGFTLKPSPDSPVSFDLGVQGYTGLREGVTGSLQIKFEF